MGQVEITILWILRSTYPDHNAAQLK